MRRSASLAVHVSPSQLETRRTCPRKWWYSRNRPRTRNKWAEYGERCHLMLERWLEHGVQPDASTPEGRTVLAGLHLVPMPFTPGMAVEHKLDDVLLFGVPWRMRLDVLYGYVRDVSVIVSDHKTTGDLAWAKLAEILADDPQWIAYSYWAAEAFNVPWVIGQWTYFRRKPPKAEPQHIMQSREVITARMWRLHTEEVAPLVAAANDPMEAHERRYSGCDAFGGCPYRDECYSGLSALDRVRSILYTSPRGIRPKKDDDTMTAPALAASLGAAIAAPAKPQISAEQWNGLRAAGHTDEAISGSYTLAPAGPAPAAPPMPPVPAPVAPAATPAYPPHIQALIDSPPPGLDVTATVAAWNASQAAGGPVAPTAPAPSVVSAPVVSAPVAGTAPTAPATVTAPAATRGRGRPATPAAIKLLGECASGGQTPAHAREYLEILAGVEGGA